jgi:hypothetical protein
MILIVLLSRGLKISMRTFFPCRTIPLSRQILNTPILLETHQFSIIARCPPKTAAWLGHSAGIVGARALSHLRGADPPGPKSSHDAHALCAHGCTHIIISVNEASEG